MSDKKIATFNDFLDELARAQMLADLHPLILVAFSGETGERVVSWANDKLYAALDLLPEDVVGRRWKDLTHPDDHYASEQESTARHSLTEPRPTLRFVNRWRCRDGRWATLRWWATADPDNHTVFACAEVLAYESALEGDSTESMPTVTESLP